VTLVVHNTPYADVVDTEDDLQPLVFSVYHDGTRAVRLVAAAMASAEFIGATADLAVPPHGVTSTELADTLVREHGLAFATAHRLAARLVAAQSEGSAERPGALLARIATKTLGRPIDYSDERLAEILGAGHFVAVRETLGGPAAPVTARAMAESRQRLASDMAMAQALRDKLASARDTLRERSGAL
jgi:argininosuccinate lyase